LQKHDLLIALGTRLGDTPTQNYQLPSLPNPSAPIIHIADTPEAIGRVFPTYLGIVTNPADFCVALAKHTPKNLEARASWVNEINNFMQGFRSYTPKNPADGMDFALVVEALSNALGDDVILTMDSGNFSSWVHLLWPFTGREQVLAAIGGAMGLGLPAAISAALRVSDKAVIAFVGDGGIMMTGNELSIAVARQLPIKLVIANNRSFGTIRLHQEKAYPERVSATNLSNPDFTLWARSFGAWAETLDSPEQAKDIVARFLAQKGPAVLNVLTSTELVSAFASVEQIRKMHIS
jgi:acetolactate synthase-1/2/3 large subunit